MILVPKNIGIKKKTRSNPQSQRGALKKFVVMGSQTNSENETPDSNIDDGHGDDAVEVEVATAEIHEGDDGHGRA